jgi:hypothetical protein
VGALSGLVAELSMPLWGLTALSLADETGLLDVLDEPRSLDDLAARAGLQRSQAEAIGDVLVAMGIALRDADTFVAAPILTPALVGPARQSLRGELRSNVLQSASLLACARSGTVPTSWEHADPALLMAQGIRSAGPLVSMWANQVFPMLDGLCERLEGHSGRFLDVGVGVAALAAALCNRYPGLTGVGIDPLDTALTQARSNVLDAGLSSRIELRAGRIEDLEERSSYDLVHIPSMFLARETLEGGAARALTALRPGGWVVVQVLWRPGAGMLPAVVRLWCTLWGGEALAPGEVELTLARAGYVSTRIVHAEGGLPLAHVAGRRPLG